MYKDYVEREGKNVMNDFVRINVYVADNEVVKTEESPQISVTQLLSNIGGQLGMWIGVSVITISKVVEVLLAMMKECLRKRREKREQRKTLEIEQKANVGQQNLGQGQPEINPIEVSSMIEHDEEIA